MIFRKRNQMTIFVTLIAWTFFYKSNACIYKKQAETKPSPSENPWNNEINQRDIENCDCGTDYDIDNHASLKPWFIAIHIFRNIPHGFIRSCMGTVVNSKMVLTSHNCLRLSNERIGVYERWDPKPRDFRSVFVQTDNIFMSWDLDPYLDPTLIPRFNVQEIIYNPDWLLREEKKSQPESDLAILIKAGDESFFDRGFVPICVPQVNDPNDPTGFIGYYYGIGGKFPADPNPEIRSIGNAFVLPGKMCDKSIRLSGFSLNDTLCIQSRLMSPKYTGGPLVMAKGGTVNPEGYTPGETVFLLGLASATKQRKDDDLIVTTYFSNIFPWIKYLEYHAKQNGAKWCRTPSFLLDNNIRNTDFKKGLVRRYIWDVGSPIKRDETLDCVCGLHNYEKKAQQSRIIGGEDADPYEFPWLTFLLVQYKPLVGEDKFISSFTCGGSIINNKLILTAAHCVILHERLSEHGSSEWDADLVDVYYSIHNTTYESDDGKVVEVKKIHYYRDYAIGLHESYLDYDIALLELEQPLQFSNVKLHGEANPKDVRPICLPNIGKPIVVVGRNATVAGWGITPNISNSNNLESAATLLKLQKPILPLEACAWKGDVTVRDTVLCAGYFNSSRDSSRGDSGGPLAIRSENGYWTQVGVVSYGRDFYDTKDPYDYTHTTALYANVQKFLRFINYYSNKVGAKWCKSYI